jgi:hypothetical protein
MMASSSKERASGTGTEILAEPRREHGERPFDFGILVVVSQVRFVT